MKKKTQFLRYNILDKLFVVVFVVIVDVVSFLSVFVVVVFWFFCTVMCYSLSEMCRRVTAQVIPLSRPTRPLADVRIILFIHSHPILHSDARCYHGWIRHRSSCYGFGEDDVTWAGAAVSGQGVVDQCAGC